MVQRQCLFCAAAVDEKKAFCPECGAPMQPEERRESPPEIGGMTKTFNLGADEYQAMLRDCKSSENSAQSPETIAPPSFQSVVIAPEIMREIAPPKVAEKKTEPKSRRTLYILLGLAAIIFILCAAVVSLIIYRRMNI